MADILDDIETIMFALDRALPDNATARDLLEILHKCRAEIGRLRSAMEQLKGYAEKRLTRDHQDKDQMRFILNITNKVLDTPINEHGGSDD